MWLKIKKEENDSNSIKVWERSKDPKKPAKKLKK